jgi:hypothetical protein
LLPLLLPLRRSPTRHETRDDDRDRHAGHAAANVHHGIPIRRKVMLRVGKTADKREAR